MNKQVDPNNIQHGLLMLMSGVCGASLMIKYADQASISNIALEIIFAYAAISGGILFFKEWRKLGD